MYSDKIVRLQREMAALERRKGQETDKLVKLNSDISSISRSVTSSTSSSTLTSKQRQIEAKSRQAADCQRRLADLDGKVANRLRDIASTQQHLDRVIAQRRRKEEAEAKRVSDAEARERRKQLADDKRRRDEEKRHQRELTQEVQRRARIQPPRLQIEVVQSLPEEIVATVFATNPLDQERLRLDEEVRLIEERMRAARYRDSVVLRPHLAVRPQDLLQALNEDQPTIVHFSGHGSADDIAFQSPDGTTKLVSKDAITQLIATTADHIRMIVFNTCYSRGQAEAVVEHVDLAIGMNTAIGDEAARVFAAQLYSSIGFGLSVRQAFDQAVTALMLEGIPEDDVPELFARGGIDPAEVVLVRPGPPHAEPAVL